MPMKIYLMNSSMMPMEGFYQRIDLSMQDWINLYNQATEVVSTVAYPEIVRIFYQATGIILPVAIEKPITRFCENECLILVIKLKFRVQAHRKGTPLGSTIDDYEFILVKYKASI